MTILPKRRLRSGLIQLYWMIPGRNFIFNLLKRVVKLPPGLTHWLRIRGTIEVKIDRNHIFKMKAEGEQIENDLFWHGYGGNWEAESLKIWARLCKNAEYIFDVGANTGIYGLVAKAVNPKAKVYAFEPLKRTFQKLKQNAALNNFEMDCLEIAASNRDGLAKVFDPGGHVYSITVNQNLNAELETIETEIETLRLDSFVKKAGLPRVDLLKIDVETHEVEVLEGMGELLRQCRPSFLIEVLTEEVANRLQALLEPLGYLYFEVNEKSGLQETPRLLASKSKNYLICQRPHADLLHLLPKRHFDQAPQVFLT